MPTAERITPVAVSEVDGRAGAGDDAGGARAVGINALLATLVARKLHDTEETERVRVLSRKVGEELGLSPAVLVEIDDLAVLRRVGYVGVADAVLHKSGALTARERAELQQHPLIAEAVLAWLPPLAHLAGPIAAIRERWDGHGYPSGLAGEAIPIPSRIVTATDAYVAMRSHRPFRGPLDRRIAAEALARNAGTQFWGPAVSALLHIEEHPLPEPAAARVVVASTPPSRAAALRELGRRLSRTQLLLAALAGVAAGVLWALPLPGGHACATADAHNQCAWNAIWGPTLMRILIGVIATVIIANLVLIRAPAPVRRWRTGTLRRPPQSWPDGTDPLLVAASWGLTRHDFTAPHRWWQRTGDWLKT